MPDTSIKVICSIVAHNIIHAAPNKQKIDKLKMVLISSAILKTNNDNNFNHVTYIYRL